MSRETVAFCSSTDNIQRIEQAVFTDFVAQVAPRYAKMTGRLCLNPFGEIE